jgi:hypothetical protein
MDKIDIDIEDNGIYTQVAFLVDRPGFVDDIKEIRKLYKIEVPFSSDPLVLEHHLIRLAGYTPDPINHLNDETVDFVMSDEIMDSSKAKENYEKLNTSLKNKKPIEDKLRKKEIGFREAITNCRRKHQYPEIFNQVVKQAVLFNTISRFKTAYATHFNRSEEDNILQPSPSDELMAIVVTPYSTKKDIELAYEECKTHIRSLIEITSPVYHMIGKDTITNIKRDRYWYWEKMSGKRYQTILDEWNNRCSYYKNGQAHPDNTKCEYCGLEDQNVIEKAVSRYKSNLK